MTDGTAPLADATVKIFDAAGTPFQHTLTDAAGQYTFSDVPAGTYTVSAVKEGYLLSDPVGVTLAGSDTVQMDLVCTADASLSLGFFLTRHSFILVCENQQDQEHFR